MLYFEYFLNNNILIDILINIINIIIFFFKIKI